VTTPAAIRDRAAIVGVGYTDYSRRSGKSTLSLALLAIKEALDDAGLSAQDLDGVVCHRIADSVDPGQVARALGIEDIRFVQDIYGGGSVSAGVIGLAAMAVACGQAECIVCFRALNARSGSRMGHSGGGTLDADHWLPYAPPNPPHVFAMYSRAYLHAVGATSEDLGRVAINQRANAALSPRAMLREPLTMEEYLASRWIVEPLRLYDCCLETDAAVALIVTSAERARALRQPPVLVSGAAFGGGRPLPSDGRTTFTSTEARKMAAHLYSSAGLGPKEVDVAELYDAFTPLVLMQLEDYGFCEIGEAADLIESGATRLDGPLPVNTHGGHLSEGYVHGLNHVAEAVNQLRWACGRRQVAGAEVALSTGQPGIMAGTTSAVLLRRGL
jgi:acetyl-CoA acetyltransferase